MGQQVTRKKWGTRFKEWFLQDRSPCIVVDTEIKRHQIRMWIKGGINQGPVLILGESIGGWAVRRIPKTPEGEAVWLDPRAVGRELKITDLLIEELAEMFTEMELLAVIHAAGR